MAPNQANGTHAPTSTNYCAYVDPTGGQERIGSLSDDRTTIQPLSYVSGTPLTSLYEVIEAGESRIVPSGELLQASSAQILPPISGRDILCVGKNYAAHATEFHKSGYDSSDKVDQPTHPVIFTKRFTSIIADGEDILPHPGFTETIDYEGELAVIIGKPGFRISEADAMDHVWGYTICNDMTARERQRDHKQFYIGKSPDTFCPLGPVAVPKEKMDKVLRVQTHVNGKLRQDATTDTLIFSIPFLIMTLSKGQTLVPGDVLATGTPAGVGFGQDPPSYLHPGDEVTVSITGLGSLTNRIARMSTSNPTEQRIRQSVIVSQAKTPNSVGLSLINGKSLRYQRSGKEDGPPAVFVHGLGGTSDYWTPLIEAGGLRSTHSIHLYDFEGHGLSPTSPLSEITIASLAEDLKAIFDHARITSGATLFAHSLGCLIATRFLLSHPSSVSKLILIGPPPSPLPEAGSTASRSRAALARSQGMAAVVDAVVTAGSAERTKKSRPVALTSIRLSLLGQNPEGYAKACSALAKSVDDTIDFSRLVAETAIITGTEDKVSPPELCEKYDRQLQNSKGLTILPDVGHWHNFEDPTSVASAVLRVL